MSVIVGDIVWDCRYHPVFVQRVVGDDVSGFSLLTGDLCECSIENCGLEVLVPEQVQVLVANRDLILCSERLWRKTENHGMYDLFFKIVDDSEKFPRTRIQEG